MVRKSERGSPPAGPLYSTDPAAAAAQRCRQCLRLRAQCVCGAAKPTVQRAAERAAGDCIVRLSRQTKGRKGAGVTCITGLPLADTELADLASRLKKLCGVGGTVRDGVIEIQGDVRERLLPELTALGYRAKIAGG